MQKRKFVQKRADDVSLPELLDRLELALTGTTARLLNRKSLHGREWIVLTLLDA